MHIEQKSSSWSFEGIADKFVEHAIRSIPGYSAGHNLIVQYSDFFCSRPTTVVDIGSSTGLLLEKIAKRHSNKPDLQMLGVEQIEDMHGYALKNTTDSRISFIHDNIENITFPTSNLVISYYTMQFISPAVRQATFQRIYDSLDWGGAFILFEKVRGADARFQDYASQIYTEFKIENEFKEEEIINKSQSLKGVMEPFSTAGNYDLLKRAGFVDTTTIFKWVCFEGFLAIK